MNAKTDKQIVIHTQESYSIRKNIFYIHTKDKAEWEKEQKQQQQTLCILF